MCPRASWPCSWRLLHWEAASARSRAPRTPATTTTRISSTRTTSSAPYTPPNTHTALRGPGMDVRPQHDRRAARDRHLRPHLAQARARTHRACIERCRPSTWRVDARAVVPIESDADLASTCSWCPMRAPCQLTARLRWRHPGVAGRRRGSGHRRPSAEAAKLLCRLREGADPPKVPKPDVRRRSRANGAVFLTVRSSRWRRPSLRSCCGPRCGWAA